MPGVVRSTAEMGTNEDSTAKEGDIETTPNEAYASIAKEGDIETAPNEAYASIVREEIVQLQHYNN